MLLILFLTILVPDSSVATVLGCGAGYFEDQDSCECDLCPIGTYNDQEAVELCTSCPPEWTTLQLGSTGESQCLLIVAGCDITLNVTDTTQYVATEGYPNYYHLDQLCEFNFVAPPGRRTIVMFEDINLEEGFDFIHFPNGDRYSVNAPTFRSYSNFTTLLFSSDEFVHETGILMSYILDPELCNDNDPCTNNRTHTQCYNPPGTRELECVCRTGFEGDSCQDRDPCADAVCRIHNFCLYSDRLAECVCSNSWTGPYCTNTQYIVAGCDITLNVTDTTQYVATRGYPHRYQNLQVCDFHFVAPPGRRTIVMFEDFALERNDYIQFPNGDSYSDNPPIFRSDSNFTTFLFISSLFGPDRGILMSYILDPELCNDNDPCTNNRTECYNPPGTRELECVCRRGFAGETCQYTAGCDITLTVTDTTQYVATEGYPESYKNNQDCDFHFVAPSDRRIIVMFEDFDLEGGFDVIHFPNGDLYSVNPPIFRSDFNSATFRFTSNSVGTGSGILMSYILDPELCNDNDPCTNNRIHTQCYNPPGTRQLECVCRTGFAGDTCQYVLGCDITLNVTDITQYVATEGYPDGYKNNQDCEFNFVAPLGRKFIVMFEDFSVSRNFYLYDYDYFFFPNNIRFYEDAPTFRSESNTATLRFTSDFHLTERGVLMAYILDEDNCASSPCKNGGTCVDDHGCYICQCTDQWLGENCTEFNNCYPDQCINGTCLDGDDAYTCSCFDGYRGTNCDEINQACIIVTCQNGGSCVYISETNNASCVCKNNFVGHFCEEYTCGISAIPPVLFSKNRKRIVGGMEVVPNSWPWQISYRSGGRHHCGGSIIAPEFIVTAAHCFPRVGDRILLGAHDEENCQGSEGCLEVTITEVRTHELYRSGGIHRNDIALVKFTPRISQFTDTISPVCLPESGDEDRLPVGTLCYTTGWGRGSGSDNLYQVHVELVSQSDCSNLLNRNGRVFYYPELMICAGDIENGQRDACGGDSGGPLVCQLPGQENWKLFGITSWGYQCAAIRDPGAYVRVVNYLDWIQNILDQEN